MFNGRPNNTKKMSPFLIPTTLLLIILTLLGCGNDDNVLAPKEAQEALLAAPSNAAYVLCKHAEGWIGPSGGTIEIPECAKAVFPIGALNKDVYITMDVEIDYDNSKIHYIFGPHGTSFNQPVRLEMPWEILKNYDGPLQLWYLEDNLEWVLVQNAIIEKTNKLCTVYVNHFSEYYFPRR
ncbi:hypothetical protein FJZ31_42615 [Candidatus Poribacteria bacterium]|nr:hypothetical protein [Candidatus Poribacteria bacterium]